MNILLIGSGGREHALAWKIAQSRHCSSLYIAPGNAGTRTTGTNIPLDVNDFEGQKAFCLAQDIRLVVVGPEEPLVKGIYDFFTSDPALQHIRVIGPSAHGAQLEGSKAFSKKFMQRHAIPTAAYAEFTADTIDEGREYIRQHSLPVVLKADGLAAGKGVVIAQTHEEALQVFDEMIVHRQFGDASSKVVIEQFLAGIEVSVFALTDGSSYKIIGHAKDYKRIGAGDTGPNTGGMGCVSPVPFVNETFMAKVVSRIIEPTINGLKQENITYKGFVFFGLISFNNEPYVIEYNCRMGDPETEVVMPRLQNDIIELFMAVYDGKLADTVISIDKRACATVVAVSGGYPGAYAKNIPVTALPELPADSGSIIFHAGTKEKDGQVLTNGGRVFAVTAYGETITEAVNTSKKVLQQMQFEGMYYRNDIGYEFQG